MMIFSKERCIANTNADPNSMGWQWINELDGEAVVDGCVTASSGKRYSVAPEWCVEYTNAEYLRRLDDFDLAKFLCDQIGGENCHRCPANRHCHFGHNGMLDWLREEANYEID
jgi:hypothetical protein